MGEHSKYLGMGVSCTYCGEHKLGVETATVKVISLEDVYFDEVEAVVDPLKPLKDQIWEAIKDSIPEPYDAIKCPMCGECVDPGWNSDIVSGELWECTDCNEVSSTEEDAEECCYYNRRYAKENERYAQQQVEEARRLLESQGFSVHRPMTGSRDDFSIEDILRGR